jgi:hypothetical protein
MNFVNIFMCILTSLVVRMQEVGFAHMRIADGVGTLLQLSGLLAKLCKVRERCKA